MHLAVREQRNESEVRTRLDLKGAMAEWLCCGLQIRRSRFDSGSRLQIYYEKLSFSALALKQQFCPSGGIGRHKGFKIPRW